MLPDHSAASFGFMLINTISPLSFDDGSRTCPHSARPHRSMRTDPLPSVCQSPSGVSAAASSTSRAILEIREAVSGAGRAASVDGRVEGGVGVAGCSLDGWVPDGAGAATSRVAAAANSTRGAGLGREATGSIEGLAAGVTVGRGETASGAGASGFADGGGAGRLGVIVSVKRLTNFRN
jgi:hypothetical protein